MENDEIVEKKYKVEKVTLKETDEYGGWIKSYSGEWQVINIETNNIIMKFEWSILEDNSEWPERKFYHGPRRVEISTNEKEVYCYYTMEAMLGFKFEGNDKDYKIEKYEMP